VGTVCGNGDHDCVEGIGDCLVFSFVRTGFDGFQGAGSDSSGTRSGCDAGDCARDYGRREFCGRRAGSGFDDGDWKPFSFFLKAGAFVFGSGLAIVPFL